MHLGMLNAVLYQKNRVVTMRLPLSGFFCKIKQCVETVRLNNMILGAQPSNSAVLLQKMY